jgi:hypothetical protein
MKYQVGDRVRLKTTKWDHLDFESNEGVIAEIYSLSDYGLPELAYRIYLQKNAVHNGRYLKFLAGQLCGGVGCPIANEDYLERIENE